MENVWYAFMAMYAGTSSAKYPGHFMKGAFMYDGDATDWSVRYWHLNQRGNVQALITSNHPELMDSYFDLYSNNLAKFKTDTLAIYGFGGAMVPEIIA